jgi:uncharacterized membrane protein YhaH (DUF805 family)
MEMISVGFFFYLECLTSWWWLTLGVATFVYFLVFLFKNDDYTLSTLKAVQLSFVGLITLIPWIKNFVSPKLEIDFRTRWIVLQLHSFTSFVTTTAMFSFFFAPLFFVLFFGALMLDHCLESALFSDIERYGLRQAIKWRFQNSK